MPKAYAREEIREMIEAREKAERDHASRLYHAEKVGMERGMQEGLQKGLQTAALSLVESGLSREQIQKALKVSPSQLDEWLAGDPGSPSA